MGFTLKAVAVPVLDLQAQYQTIRNEIEPVVQRLFESQMFVMGPEVAELEVELAKLSGGSRNRLCLGNRCAPAALDGDWDRAGR